MSTGQGKSGFVVEFAYSLGQPVLLIELNRPGTVISCLRDSDGLQYRVVYWDNGARKSEWLYGFEIKA